jgi:TPR repeat protein
MTTDDLKRALDLAAAGAWHEAHGIVQADEDDPMAAWIHGMLHKIEGDRANARYWYRRAARLDHVDDEPAAEMEAIRAALAD